MEMAHVAAKRSLCSRDQVGAVIVSDDQVVISTGRNGPPRFYPHDEQPCTEWCDRARNAKYLSIDYAKVPPQVQLEVINGEIYDHGRVLDPKHYKTFGIIEVDSPSPRYDDCPSLHAEANALLSAERSERLGGTIYVTSAICFGCAKLIANSGLVSVVMPAFTYEQATARGWSKTEEFFMLLSINVTVLD
jgi:deoxycytidylate deaminase